MVEGDGMAMADMFFFLKDPFMFYYQLNPPINPILAEVVTGKWYFYVLLPLGHFEWQTFAWPQIISDWSQGSGGSFFSSKKIQGSLNYPIWGESNNTNGQFEGFPLKTSAWSLGWCHIFMIFGLTSKFSMKLPQSIRESVPPNATFRCNVSQCYDLDFKKEGGGGAEMKKSVPQLIEYYKSWLSKYPFVSIEVWIFLFFVLFLGAGWWVRDLPKVSWMKKAKWVYNT